MVAVMVTSQKDILILLKSKLCSNYESGSPSKEEPEGEFNDEMNKENQKFLEELDEDLSSDESESDWDGDSDDGFTKKQVKKTKRKKANQKKSINQPMILPGALKSEMSEYEKIRDENIKEREEMLKALMADWNDFKTQGGAGQEKKTGGVKRKRKERIEMPGEQRRSSRLSQKPEDKEKLGSEKWDVEGQDRHRLADPTP